MKLDLRIQGKFSIQQATKIEQIAKSIRHSFTDFIRELSEPHKSNLDWWVEGPASRNTFSSPLFHYCCSLVLVQNYLDEKIYISEIIVDSRAFKQIVKDVLDNYGESTPVIFQNKRKKDLKTNLKSLLGPLYYIIISLYRNFFYFYQARITRFLGHDSAQAEGPLVLIDTFVLPGFIENDRNYTGLEDNLTEEEQKYVYFVPTLFGFATSEYFSVFQKLRKSSRNFLIKEDYLKVWDYFFAFGHIWRIWKLKIPHVRFNQVDFSILVKEELHSLNGLGSAILALLNYRFSFRLFQTGVRIRRVINWFENQVHDKGWNAGFQQFFPKIECIGFQGFITSSHYLCSYPTEFEHQNGLLPSEIAVIGEGHVNSRKEFFPNLKVNVVPAFRFHCVWKERNYFPDSEYFTVLIALPILLEEASMILRMMAQSLEQLHSPKLRIWIKPHPANSTHQIKQAFSEMWPKQFIFVKGTFNEFVEKSDLLLGNISSSSVEALAKGVPVIIIGNPNGLTHNPIHKSIKEDIWCLCKSSKELSDGIKFFQNRDHNTIENHLAISRQIRKDFFTPVTFNSARKFLGFSID